MKEKYQKFIPSLRERHSLTHYDLKAKRNELATLKQHFVFNAFFIYGGPAAIADVLMRNIILKLLKNDLCQLILGRDNDMNTKVKAATHGVTALHLNSKLI
ncbi:hypothetical protein DWB61_13335 [Ancylomarina euxinus]|uniref:Uncharacterized protein n=1 Tax=Ancylomarina euxinus TaxID=2283627 RepID=A0A425XYF1_9BACT|nr:hypothetical protein DWB61_13335 [Ancylomarina euxinus]